MSERIEAAAIFMDDVIWSVPPPGRHHDVIRYIAEQRPWQVPITGEQGFITNTGRFVDRSKGAEIAWAAGQVRDCVDADGMVMRRPEPDRLFSEDMW